MKASLTTQVSVVASKEKEEISTMSLEITSLSSVVLLDKEITEPGCESLNRQKRSRARVQSDWQRFYIGDASKSIKVVKYRGSCMK